MCDAPSRVSLEVRLIKAVPRDRRRLKQHFFYGYLCLQMGRGGGLMLMENNRLINTGETALAIGCMLSIRNQKSVTMTTCAGPFKCTHRLPYEEGRRCRYVCPAPGPLAGN